MKRPLIHSGGRGLRKVPPAYASWAMDHRRLKSYEFPNCPSRRAGLLSPVREGALAVATTGSPSRPPEREGSEQIQEFLRRQPRIANETTEQTRLEFAMLRYGEADSSPQLDQVDVTPVRVMDSPTGTCERLHSFQARDHWELGHRGLRCGDDFDANRPFE